MAEPVECASGAEPLLPYKILHLLYIQGARGGAVVETLRYKPEGRGFGFRLCYWIFSLA
jgi:hypothetical protein